MLKISSLRKSHKPVLIREVKGFDELILRIAAKSERHKDLHLFREWVSWKAGGWDVASRRELHEFKGILTCETMRPVRVLLIEPASTLNTGNVQAERTVSRLTCRRVGDKLINSLHPSCFCRSPAAGTQSGS